jgi:phosphate transport system substrate-binding protein
MNGSLDQPGKSHALAVWVHADNPLVRMTLAQLDAVFGAEHRRGAPKTFRNWGDLGLTGDWAGQPIHAYGYDVDTGTAAYFRQTVLAGSRKWNWEALREFKRLEQPDGSVLTADRQIVDAVAGDRYGIGVANLPDPGMRVKAVALAAGDGEAILPTRETVMAQTYPLARTVWAAFNRAPGQPADPGVKEFLAYVLSPEGQGDVARDGGYLPLAAGAGERGASEQAEGK